MKRLNLIIGIIIGIILSSIVSMFLIALWLLGAPKPFAKWNAFMDSLIFFDKKK